MKQLLSIAIVLYFILAQITMSNGGYVVGSMTNRSEHGFDFTGGIRVIMEAQTTASGSELQGLMRQTKRVIENRIKALGIPKSTVTIEGEKRLRIEIPIMENAEDLIALLGRSAQLQFMLADGTVIIDRSMIKSVSAIPSRMGDGLFEIQLQFDEAGTESFLEATTKAYNGQVDSVVPGIPARSIGIMLDGIIISAPNVMEPITGGVCSITGNFTQREAENLVLQIKSGALPVELIEVDSSRF